jgi:predicted anti-sigma-YlaC factor YlaD
MVQYWISVPGMPTRHISDDNLELCALDRPVEADAALVEEHLLVCEKCRERLAGWDEYVRAMRAAGQQTALDYRERHL